MSARIITNGPSPFLSIATTPVPPTFAVTSKTRTVEFFRHAFGSTKFCERKFGVTMKVIPQRRQVFFVVQLNALGQFR